MSQRRVLPRWTWTIPFLLLVGCGDPPIDRADATAAGLLQSTADLLCTATSPATGQAVRVLNGGDGSALAVRADRPHEFHLLSDRGPNIEANDGKAFPAPAFTPRIGVFHRVGSALV